MLELDLNSGLQGGAAYAAGMGWGLRVLVALSSDLLTSGHPGLQTMEDGCHPVLRDDGVRDVCQRICEQQ